MNTQSSRTENSTRSTSSTPFVRRTAPREQLPVNTSSVWTYAVTTRHITDSEFVSALHDIAAQYDVRQMSLDGMAAMAGDLAARGFLNFKGLSILTFQSEKPDADSASKPFRIEHLTQPDAHGRRDWITEYEAQVALWERHPECASYVEHQRELLEVLRRIDAVRAELRESSAA